LSIERFDREKGMRVPMHTAAGAANVDFRMPQLDYVALLRLTNLITHDAREVLEAFARCVFNVVFNNRDDHSKNFSFLMEKGGQWKFSPGYDLTFSEGPRGEHQMDICGEARAPAGKHLLQLANKTGISEQAATEIVEQITAIARDFTDFADKLPIRKDTVKNIAQTVRANCARLV